METITSSFELLSVTKFIQLPFILTALRLTITSAIKYRQNPGMKYAEYMAHMGGGGKEEEEVGVGKNVSGQIYKRCDNVYSN
jgi:hypothetical protein